MQTRTEFQSLTSDKSEEHGAHKARSDETKHIFLGKGVHSAKRKAAVWGKQEDGRSPLSVIHCRHSLHSREKYRTCRRGQQKWKRTPQLQNRKGSSTFVAYVARIIPSSPPPPQKKTRFRKYPPVHISITANIASDSSCERLHARWQMETLVLLRHGAPTKKKGN